MSFESNAQKRIEELKAFILSETSTSQMRVTFQQELLGLQSIINSKPIIPNNPTPAPVAEPTTKLTMSQLIPQTTTSQTNKIPLLPIAAGVGVLLLILAVAKRKKK